MDQYALTASTPDFRSRVKASVNSIFITIIVLIVLNVILPEQRMYAQSACAQLGVDCSHHSSNTIPAIGTQQMMQQQVASTVVNAFVNMLFSNDTQATAQKQKMMAELQARQAEAIHQQKREEAARLEAICQRLQGTLKLSGTPELKLKSDASTGGDLQLKLGDQSSGPIGVPGLPGIALNDNSGNGGSTPYGINGLPGIYTNGPATAATAPSGDAQVETGGLKLKMDDAAGSPQTTAQTADAPTDAAVTAALPDPRTMSPQQLADLAQNLSPEQQQQLANALQTAQSGGAVRISQTTTVSAAPASTTTAALQNAQSVNSPSANPHATVGAGQTTGADSSALGQLKGTAAASQKAANADTLEGAAAGAREGFDTAASGSTSPIHPSGGGATQTVQNTAHVGSGTTGSTTNATIPFQTGTTHNPVVDMAVLQPPPAPIANAPNKANNAATPKAQCVTPTRHKLPTRDELLTELAQRRTELANLRQSILRLNHSIQMDQKQFAEWQAEAEAGYDRVVNRVLSLPTKLAMDTFMEMNDVRFERAENMKVLTEKGLQQKRMLERATELRSFDDFQKWILEDKSNPEMYDEAVRQLISDLPFFSPEVKSYANCAEDLIDNAYDYVDLVSTWNNVQQLDRNSNQFLTAVHGNGERMKSLMTRIQQIEAQLNGVPQDVQLPYCSQ